MKSSCKVRRRIQHGKDAAFLAIRLPGFLREMAMFSEEGAIWSPQAQCLAEGK